MTQPDAAKTTFQVDKVIQPIYTGGPVALSENGRLLATCLGGDALLTDLTNGTRLLHIEGDGEVITSLSLTPSASHLIVCSRSLLLKIYNLSHNSPSDITGRLLRSFKPHTSPVVTSAVDHTGTLVATGGSDGVIKIWDIQRGYATHTFHGHGGIISALHFFKLASLPPQCANTKKPKKMNGKGSNGDVTTDSIHDVSYFRLASGSEDGKIRIWNLEKSKATAVLDSHVSVVRSLEYDPEANLLLSASRDKTVMLWDANSWALKSTIPVLEGVENSGFLASGSLIFTGGDRGILRLWNLQTLKEITEDQPSRNHGQRIIDVLHHKHLPFMVSVHADNTFKVHSTRSLDKISDCRSASLLPIISHISGSHDEIIDLAYCGRTRSLLAVATNAEEVRILSVGRSEIEPTQSAPPLHNRNYFGSDIGLLQGHEDIVICLDDDWSGCWMVTGAKDNTARLWRIDAENGSFTCFAIFTGHTESIGAIALPKVAPPTGTAAYDNPLENPPRFLLTGSQDKTIKRWDSSNILASSKRASRATYTRKAHDKDINALDINHDSTLFATASQDRLVKIWSIQDGEAVGILKGHRRGVWSVKFAPHDASPVSGETGIQTSVSRGLVLTGSGDKTVKLWSLTDYACLRTFEGHTNSVLKVLWMKPSNEESQPRRKPQIASAGGDGLVKVWNANNGEVECTLDNHEDRVWALVLDPETRQLVSGAADSTITFWKDTTNSTVAAAIAASTARIEQDQELQNHIHARSYREAITLALQLNHPARLLSLFTSVVSKTPPDLGSLCGDSTVDEVLGSLEDEQLFLLLLRIRDWNTNMRTAPIAQRILWTLLKSYPSSRFTRLKNNVGSGGNTPSAKDLLDGMRAYTDRQYRRMEELIDESYLVEYTLREMDGIGLEVKREVGKENIGYTNDEKMQGM